MSHTSMQEFRTRAALMNAYRIDCERSGMGQGAAKIIVTQHCKYVPHLYRGGFVIPGFGYSVERIGRYVAPEAAGSPEAVR